MTTAAPPRPRMDAWRRRFARRIALLNVALQLPAGLLLGALLAPRLGALPAAGATLLALVALNAPLAYRLTHWREDTRSHALHVWAADVPYFLHFCTCLVFAPLAYVALLGVGVGAVLGLHAAPPVQRYLGPLYLAALAVGAYGSFPRRFWHRVRDVHVTVRGLPAALDGYTLVQLSDVHCGPYLPRWYYRALARRASALGGDVVVVTGDLITSGVGYLDDVRDFAAHLRAPGGVYACMGNHDYFGTVAEVPAALAAGGARVLRNEGVVLAPERAGGVFLAAIDDAWSKRDDVDLALAARPLPAGPCVLLAHDPASFPAIAARGDVDLVLSGHTHAGQIALPFAVRRYNLAAIRGRFTAGLYREGRTALYVHAGNGTSGPPVRFGAAPEIARVVLHREG